MAVVRDSITTATSTSFLSSFSFTVTPVGTPTALAAIIASTGSTISSVTYNAVNVPFADGTGFNFTNGGIYGLASPVAGPQTIVFNYSGSATQLAYAVAELVTGSDPATCFDHTVNNTTGFGVNVSATCVSAANDLVVSFGFDQNGSVLTDGLANLTPGWSAQAGVGPYSFGGDVAGASTVNSTIQAASNDALGIVMASFKAAAAGSAIVNRRTLGPRVGSRSYY